MKLVRSFLKGLFVVIAVVCIAFTAFFLLAAARGDTAPIDRVERGVFALVHATGATLPGTTSEDTSAVGLLTSQYGLTTSQAGQIVSMADQLGVDVSDSAEMSALVAKNIGNADEIRDIASRYQSGQISESQAKALLAGVINV